MAKAAPKTSNVSTLPRSRTGPQPGSKQRPKIHEWSAIERDYRSGILPLDEIAAIHSTSRQSIIQKAKRAGWERSLAPKIRREVANQLIDKALIAQREVTPDVTRVVAVATQTVEVITKHRRWIAEMQAVACGQLEELRAVTVAPGELANVLRIGSDAAGAFTPEELKSALNTVSKLCALPSRMGALNQLTGIYERLLTLERQAFGIKPEDSPEDDEDDDVKGMIVTFVDAPFRELE